jgi:hypothetical protein
MNLPSKPMMIPAMMTPMISTVPPQTWWELLRRVR